MQHGNAFYIKVSKWGLLILNVNVFDKKCLNKRNFEYESSSLDKNDLNFSIQKITYFDWESFKLF